MTMDILGNVLSRADNPAAVSQYLAEEIRELTGARCVLLIQHHAAGSRPSHRIVSLNPARRQAWAKSPMAMGLYDYAYRMEAVGLWRGEDSPRQETVLREEGFALSLVVPLKVGDVRVGTMLLLGLPGTDGLPAEIRLLETLSTVVALVLRNAFLYEEQERTIAARTRELQTANATLNLTQFSVDSARDAIFWLTPEGRVTYANAAACLLIGCSLEELRCRRAGDLNPQHQSAEAWAAHWAELKSTRSTTYETELRTAKGSFVRVEVTANHLAYGGQELNCAIVRDITERRQLEERLRQAQKMEAIGQLAGGVAHDFNNILAATMMHLSLLQQDPRLEPDILQAIGELQAEAQRAATLTRQLLMFSRRSVLDIKSIDLNEVVSNLLRMLGRLIGEHIDLQFHCRTVLPAVAADPGLIEQVLLNLSVNARDAMPKGGRLIIATEALEVGPERAKQSPDGHAGRFVCLSVEDTGCGMEEATLERLFEPFFTTKEVGKGTGLGLATAYGIVAQHKGWIEVTSQPGRGTTFRVYLPASPNEAAKATADTITELRGGKETILLVEDEPSVRRTVARGLRSLGYEVLEAENGQAAVTLWRNLHQHIHLLLTDLVMPEGMTGLELAQRLKAAEPGLRVIISSGYSAGVAQEGSPAEDGIVYLPKPYDKSVLAKTVRDCLDRA
jgi:PAS domain S-box-containing protein